MQSSTYSAEYGRNPGGQFAFETKSGTNQWHGTAYDYLRNGAFDAQDWFNDYFGTKRNPPFGRMISAAHSAGRSKFPDLYHGKDKTFFFVSYEGLAPDCAAGGHGNFVPDLCMRGMWLLVHPARSPSPEALQPVLNAFRVPSSNGLEDAANGVWPIHWKLVQSEFARFH